jgi:hypothetical protein
MAISTDSAPSGERDGSSEPLDENTKVLNGEDATNGADSSEAHAAPAIEGPNQPAANLPGLALDDCFAHDAWALPLREALQSMPEIAARASDGGLLAAAAGIAVAVNMANRDPQKRPALASQRKRPLRQQICPLDGR